jgi:hypothetical protein
MKWVSLIVFILAAGHYDVKAQKPDATFLKPDYTLLEQRVYSHSSEKLLLHSEYSETNEEYPSPRSVMFKSLMIPGWGQITNRQVWKVPIIYGAFAGIGYYTHYLHQEYKDYRAAYYNSFPENDDFRFGPTPERLEGVNANQLQSNRNSLRNQRDFMFVVMGLAYGLNVLDAYVFAHMRSFDVSDDLSAKTTIGPALLADQSPGVSVRLTFSKR